MMQIFSGASSGGWFEKAQRFGKSFMLPIAVLPAAGLLLGIGGALSNPNTLAAYPFLDVSWLQAIFTIMSSAGSIVFANLSVLFAVGVAVGLAKSDKGTAGLAALLAFLVMNATINALLILTGKLAHENPGAVGQGMTLGIQTLETGVFGGVLRDMFCKRIPLVFQKELYAGVSFAAAILYIALQHYVSSHDVVVISTLLFGFTARMLALRWKLGLPVFNYNHSAH